ncbi:CBS domain-containing protein [Aestuariimicrobium soli]|uniref:CBS domain-containing protein n=1 Tax=Aestuariimicrobium soli TaxID=2035834 RepID=UPI003EB6C4AA
MVVKGLAAGLDVDKETVEECCSHHLVSVAPDASSDEVAQALAGNQLRRLLVVEGDQVVGIISQADLARQLSNAATGDVVEAISR